MRRSDLIRALDLMVRRLAARGALPPTGHNSAGAALRLAAAALIGAGGRSSRWVRLLLSRLADGLSGAVARHTAHGFRRLSFDIASDFLFYGSVPLGFVLAEAAGNGAAGAFLLAAFYFQRDQLSPLCCPGPEIAGHGGTTAQGVKSLYFSNGLLKARRRSCSSWPCACFLRNSTARLDLRHFALLCQPAALISARARRVFKTGKDPG